MVVPAFNEAAAIGAVVAALRAEWPRVVVVDDGSADATGAEARRHGAHVLTHLVNRGQGAALQTGLTYALRQGARYIVTFDADGQHRVEDIARLVAPLAEGRCEVALGSRFLEPGTAVPRGRRLLLKAAVLMTRLTSRLPLTDAHNGLRALSRRAAAGIRLRLDRMAHASEIVDQIARLRLPVLELPVRVRYTAYSRAKGQRGTDAVKVLVDYLLARLFG